MERYKVMSHEGKEVFCIWRPESGCMAVDDLQELLADSRIERDDFVSATLEYRGQAAEPMDPMNFPLKFQADGKEVWVSGVSTGQRGEGSCCAISALQLMGFPLSGDECTSIYTKHGVPMTFAKR